MSQWDTNDEKHAIAMTQLQPTMRPTLIATYPRGRDKSNHQNWLRASCEIHQSPLQDGNYFLHEYVPRDQSWSDVLIHDLLMIGNVWHVRVDPERVETDPDH